MTCRQSGQRPRFDQRRLAAARGAIDQPTENVWSVPLSSMRVFQNRILSAAPAGPRAGGAIPRKKSASWASKGETLGDDLQADYRTKIGRRLPRHPPQPRWLGNGCRSEAIASLFGKESPQVVRHVPGGRCSVPFALWTWPSDNTRSRGLGIVSSIWPRRTGSKVAICSSSSCRNSAERRPSRQQFVEDHPQTEDVGAASTRCASPGPARDSCRLRPGNLGPLPTFSSFKADRNRPHGAGCFVEQDVGA